MGLEVCYASVVVVGLTVGEGVIGELFGNGAGWGVAWARRGIAFVASIGGDIFGNWWWWRRCVEAWGERFFI